VLLQDALSKGVAAKIVKRIRLRAGVWGWRAGGVRLRMDANSPILLLYAVERDSRSEL
jgi:hypothetical protein